MKQYLEILTKILQTGVKRPNRTGMDALTLFGCQMRFNLAKDFPLLTTKKVNFEVIIRELLWFIKGETNIKYLVDNGVKIWNKWPFEKYKQRAIESSEIKLLEKSSLYFPRINKGINIVFYT